MAADDLAKLLERHAAATTDYLRERLPRVTSLGEAPPRLREAIEYSLLAPGKRLRPALVLETFAALGQAAASPSPALPAAAAVELIHTFSLVHDDLPAMDDDDLRRGRPTSHKVFGEAMAILAGDAMTALAFELLAGEYANDPPLARELVRELALAAGPAGMVGGQALDIAGEGQTLSREALTDIHRRKTGALITAACRMGGLVAGVDDARLLAVTHFGRHLGLAFQISDDLLDVSATAEAAGKATQKDAAARKSTYPATLGVVAARQAAEQEAQAAIAALKGAGMADPTGLEALARLTVNRDR